DEGTTFMLLFVQGVDGFLGRVVVGHFNKPEAFASAGVAILDDLGTLHGSKLGKHLLQARARHAVGQVSDVQLLCHRFNSSTAFEARSLLSGPKGKWPVWWPTRWNARERLPD